MHRLVIFFAISFCTTIARAQTPVYFSPGLKLGYHFDRGFIFGLEASVTAWPGAAQSHYGLSLNLDFMSAQVSKLHLGVEVGGVPVGIQYGPTLIMEAGTTARLGSTITCYALMFVMPYMGYTWNMGPKGGTELGVLGKYPIHMNNDRFDIL